MNMITMRKVARYTVLRETDSITLDPEKFRNISVPYEGNTDKEFIKYIDSNIEEFYDNDELWSELDEATQIQLGTFLEPEYREFYNSAWDDGDSFIESGIIENGDRFITEETTDWKCQ